IRGEQPESPREHSVWFWTGARTVARLRQWTPTARAAAAETRAAPCDPPDDKWARVLGARETTAAPGSWRCKATCKWPPRWLRRRALSMLAPRAPAATETVCRQRDQSRTHVGGSAT